MPYYQFNSFTGRIRESTHPQAFYPISPNRLDCVEPPKPIYATPDMKPVQVPSVTKSEKFFSTLSPEFVKKIEKFQAPHNRNVPVHLKGGVGDKILFGTTTVLIAIGLANCMKLYYDLSFPKK